MVARIDKLSTMIVNPGGPKLYKNPSINKGTRVLFDCSNKSSGGGASVDAGATLISRSPEASTGTFILSHNYSGGGMVWEGLKNDKFSLPSQIVPSPSDKNWMVTTWLKITNGGSTGFNNQTLSIGGAYNNFRVYLRVVPTCDANGVPTTIEVRCMSKQYVVTNQLLPLYDGAVHQFAVQCETSADGQQQRVIIWLDKVSVYNSGFSAIAKELPTDSTERYVGSSNSLPRSFAGSFYRIRFDDLTSSGLPASDVLSSDYSNGKPKYS
ncbi:hypothetical protein [Erwinia phage Gungnir39]|nr:hypothetical protein [Erwinia phage Gungnir39]